MLCGKRWCHVLLGTGFWWHCLNNIDTIPVDWVGISRTPVKKLRAYETGNPRSSGVSVNYIGLNELKWEIIVMFIWSIVNVLIWYFMICKEYLLFSPKLSIAHNNLVDSDFWNKVFVNDLFLPVWLSRTWKLLLSILILTAI